MPFPRPRPAAALALVPLAWAAGCWALMRPDAPAPRPDVPAAARCLVYDESDLGALVLRGGNAHLTSRLPGLPADRPWATPADLNAALDGPPGAYLPRYYLEYPTPALALFWLGFALQPGLDGLVLPPAVADCNHVAVAHHVPRTDEERRLWTAFRWAARFDLAVTAFAAAGLILVLVWGYGPGAGPAGPVWLAVLPAAVYFGVNRFDVLPALATALSFACLGRGRHGWAGAWLAVGVAFKLYPVLFAPIILRFLGPRAGLRWLAGFAVVGLLMLAASVAAVGWDGTLGPVRVQLSRPPEKGWTLFGPVFPRWLAYSGNARLLVVGLAVLAAAVTRPRDVAGVLRRCGAVLVVFVSLAVFWSPQWVVWFLPLVIPVARGRPGLIAVAVAVDLVNYWNFPILYRILGNSFRPDVQDVLALTTIYVRAAAWAALAGALVWDERRAVSPRPRPGRPLCRHRRRAGPRPGRRRRP